MSKYLTQEEKDTFLDNIHGRSFWLVVIAGAMFITLIWHFGPIRGQLDRIEKSIEKPTTNQQPEK
jgi:hypothetical protein